MPFDTTQEQELASLRAITHELNRRARECQGQLDRIEAGQDKVLGRYPPLLAFVHIPKTAGGTVSSMFSAAYSREVIRKTGNYVRNPEKTERKIASNLRQDSRVAVGHTPYGALRSQLPSDTRYMTFLREPVDRVLSHYYRHLHRKKPVQERSPRRLQHRLETPGKVRASSKTRTDSIEEALVDLRLPEINNLATRFLCGHESPLKELPASALDDAKQNLRGFAFVGIQERFEESLVLLQRMLGLGLVPYRDRHVSSGDDRPSVDEIPDEQRALIEECNQLDVELYRFGRELFEEAVATADEGFAADVEMLRASSADASEESIHEARKWLDRELPVGSTRVAAELRSAAKAAGIKVQALAQVLIEPSVKRKSLDGKKAFTRVSEPGTRP